MAEYFSKETINELIDKNIDSYQRIGGTYVPLQQLQLELEHEQPITITELTDDLYKLCDDFGLNKEKPVENIKTILEQYQKIIRELTGSFFTKITYDANVIINYVQDKQMEQLDKELKDYQNSLSNINENCYLCQQYRLLKNDELYMKYDHKNSVEFEKLEAKYCPICGKLLRNI